MYLTCVIHSDAVQDAVVFNKLLSFSEGLTFKPALCVMTPANPYVRKDMKLRGVSEKEFVYRLRTLSKYYEIGLHGHWCRPLPQGTPAVHRKPGRPTRIEEAGFELTLDDPAAVEQQFLAERSWLTSNFGTPLVYSAGWWFLDGSILRLLDNCGFAADCSFRYGQPDSFGNTALQAQALPPPGRPFGLPPSGRVIELPSLSYLHWNWWSVVRSALPLLRSRGGPLFASLPLHDYNLLDDGGKAAVNIALLSEFGNVRWLAVTAAAVLARAELKK